MVKGIGVFSLTLVWLAASVFPLGAQESGGADDRVAHQSPAPSAGSGTKSAPAAIPFPVQGNGQSSFGGGNEKEQPAVPESPAERQEEAVVEPPPNIVPPPPTPEPAPEPAPEPDPTPVFIQPPFVVMCNNGSGGSA